MNALYTVCDAHNFQRHVSRSYC